MNVWRRMVNDRYPIQGVTELEHAEFGRSTADVFPSPIDGKWEIAIDGEMVNRADDHEMALREAEIDAWNSQANTLFARRMRP